MQINKTSPFVESSTRDFSRSNSSASARKSIDSASSNQTIAKSPFGSVDMLMGVAHGNEIETCRRKSSDAFRDLSLSSRQVSIGDNDLRLSDSPIRSMTKEYAKAGRVENCRDSTIGRRILERKHASKKHGTGSPEETVNPCSRCLS